MDNLTVTIMAGGAGIRFWPLSTAERPKQFLKLTGERSLLQAFGGLPGLLRAAPEDIARVEGIGANLAQEIHAALRSD